MPSEFELPTGSFARGVLVLSNTGETTLRHVRVRYAGAGGSIRLTIGTARKKRRPPRPLNTKQIIPPGESISLGIRVARVSEGSGKNINIRLVATYFETPAENAIRGKHVTTSTLTVKPAASPTLVEARIEANFDRIDENRSAEGALVITNPREARLRITEVQVRAPEDVKVSLICLDANHPLNTADGKTETFRLGRIRTCLGTALVQPRSQEVLPAHFSTASSSLVPGDRTIVMRVRASDPRPRLQASVPRTHPSQTVLAFETFTVGVFAESEILDVIGVPIFLLLPGVIIVAVAWFFFRKLGPHLGQGNRTGEPKGIDALLSGTVEKASAAAIAWVGLSLVIALIYPLLTRRTPLIEERDLLKGYAFKDFYYVFAYSLVMAFIIWAVVIILFYCFRIGWWLLRKVSVLFRKVSVLFRRLFVLTEADEPGDVLRKVALTGFFSRGLRRIRLNPAFGSTRLARVSLNGQPNGRALRLGRRKGQVIIGPTIRVDLEPSVREGLAAEIEEHLNKDEPLRLWLKIRGAVRRQEAQLAYQDIGSVPGVRLRNSGEVNQTRQEGPIVAIPAGP